MLRRLLTAGLATGLLFTPSATASPGYTNPVTAGYSADFPDPAVIRGQDGYWYAYATGGPYAKNGSDGDSYKIARSRDLTHWEKVGSVFHAGNRPAWADPTSGFWAPDIRYINGKYVLYFTVHNTTTTPDNWDYAIGVATADSPAGPWIDSGAPVVAPRPASGGGFQWTIDPAEFTDSDGTRYLYWGSYNGGIHLIQLTPDGLKSVGEVTTVARDRFEAPYVVKRDGWYYLFGSSSNCCAGPTTGYAVFAGRSRSPKGPFLDRTDPFVTNTNGWLLRPMLLDRLDWIDGWPVVNAGAGPSEASSAAPVTTSAPETRGDIRVEADLQGQGQGVYARRNSRGDQVRAVVEHGRLKVEAIHRGRAVAARSVPVPLDGPGNLAVEIRGNQLTAEVSEDRLGDPHATLALRLPGGAGSAGAIGAVGNFSVAPLYRPVPRAVPAPRIGVVDPGFSDDFRPGLDDGWSWRNESPDAVVSGGALRWPTESNDLTNASAAHTSLLLRDQPDGEFVVETKLSLDVGTDTVRNFQQAGLLVYLDDENWMRLDHVAGGTGRFVEFGKRMRFTPVGATPVVTFGGAMIGAPGATTWLRLAHDRVPGTGEHRYRAGSSTDGKRWVWGAAWTLPAGTTPRIGLVSHGSSPEAEAAHGKATAVFDYFRVTR